MDGVPPYPNISVIWTIVTLWLVGVWTRGIWWCRNLLNFIPKSRIRSGSVLLIHPPEFFRGSDYFRTESGNPQADRVRAHKESKTNARRKNPGASPPAKPGPPAGGGGPSGPPDEDLSADGQEDAMRMLIHKRVMFGKPKTREELRKLAEAEILLVTTEHRVALENHAHALKLADVAAEHHQKAHLRTLARNNADRAEQISAGIQARKLAFEQEKYVDEARRHAARALEHEMYLRLFAATEASKFRDIQAAGEKQARTAYAEENSIRRAEFEFEALRYRYAQEVLKQEREDAAREQAALDAAALVAADLERRVLRELRLNTLLEAYHAQALARRWPGGAVPIEDLEKFEQALGTFELFAEQRVSPLYGSEETVQNNAYRSLCCPGVPSVLAENIGEFVSLAGLAYAGLIGVGTALLWVHGVPIVPDLTGGFAVAVAGIAVSAVSTEVAAPPLQVGDTVNRSTEGRAVVPQSVYRYSGEAHALHPGRLATEVTHYCAITREMRNSRPGGNLTRQTAQHLYSHFMHTYRDAVFFRGVPGEPPLLDNNLIVNSARVASQEIAICNRLMLDASEPLVGLPWQVG